MAGLTEDAIIALRMEAKQYREQVLGKTESNPSPIDQRNAFPADNNNNGNVSNRKRSRPRSVQMEENAKKLRGLEIIARTSNPQVKMYRLDDDEIDKFLHRGGSVVQEEEEEEADQPKQREPKDTNGKPKNRDNIRAWEKPLEQLQLAGEEEEEEQQRPQPDQVNGSMLKQPEEVEEVAYVATVVKKEPTDHREEEVPSYDAMKAYNDAALLVAEHKRCTLNREIAARKRNKKLWLRAGKLRNRYGEKLVKIIREFRHHGQMETAEDFEKALVKATEKAGEVDADMLGEGFGFES